MRDDGTTVWLTQEEYDAIAGSLKGLFDPTKTDTEGARLTGWGSALVSWRGPRQVFIEPK